MFKHLNLKLINAYHFYSTMKLSLVGSKILQEIATALDEQPISR